MGAIKKVTTRSTKKGKALPAAPLNPFKLSGREWNKEAVLEIVFDRIANSTLSITTILKEGHNGHPFPNYSTFTDWLRVADERMLAKYAQAKEDQAEFMAEEMLEIADDGSNDYMERQDKDGKAAGYFINGEATQRSRLRVETRKWLLGKLKPKKYGEKTILTGPNGGPIKTQSTLIDPVALAAMTPDAKRKLLESLDERPARSSANSNCCRLGA